MRRAALLALALFLAAPGLALPLSGPGACGLPSPMPPCNRWASRLPLGPANEVHIAVDPTNAQHLLAVGKDYSLGRNGDCRPAGAYHVASGSYVTFDGGATWSTARVPAPYPNGGAQPSPLAYKCGSDPVAAFAPDGTAYYILLNFQYTGGRQASIAVARSPDGGLSWPASDIRVLHADGGDDKEWGAVDSAKRVHVAWSDGGALLYARSSPGFVFEPARAVASGSGIEVGIGPNDEVYLFWQSGSSIAFTRSLDHGLTFAPARTAFNVRPYDSGGPPRFPFMLQLAVDSNPASPFAGRIYVTWPDTRAGDSGVFLASSGDGGATWTAPVEVDDNTMKGKRQLEPTVSVAPNGRVDVAWQDERLDPGSTVTNQLAQAGTFTTWVSHSTDAGATWSKNQLASDAPLQSSWSFHQDGSIFIGDYMGIASTPAAAWPVFPGNSPARLLDGLTLQTFQRVDATTAAVPLTGGLPLASAGPPGVVASIPLDAAAARPWDGAFLD